MILVCEVKVVDFTLEGFQDLAVTRHVCCQNQHYHTLQKHRDLT